MDLKNFNQFVNEDAPAPAPAGAQPSGDATIQDLQKSSAAYTQNKAKVDALLKNPALTKDDQTLQAEYDKIVAASDNKDLINIYFATKKLELKKTQLDAQMKELGAQIQQKSAELAAAEKNLT